MITEQTPTPGQPLSEADVQNGWIVWSGGEKPPCSGVVHLKFRDGECLTSDAALYDWLHSPRRNAPDDIIAYRPHAPVSRPGDGVEGDLARDVEVLLSDLRKARDKRKDGDPVRDEFDRHIRTVEALTPPAEPVSRPAGEGEREAVARLEKYLYERTRMRQTDPNVIHGLHVGTDREAVLLADDLRSIIALLSPAAPDAGGGVIDALDEALTYIEKLGENIERNDLDMHLDAVERPFSFAQTMRSRFPSLCTALQPGGER